MISRSISRLVWSTSTNFCCKFLVLMDPNMSKILFRESYGNYKNTMLPGNYLEGYGIACEAGSSNATRMEPAVHTSEEDSGS